MEERDSPPPPPPPLVSLIKKKDRAHTANNFLRRQVLREPTDQQGNERRENSSERIADSLYRGKSRNLAGGFP